MTTTAYDDQFVPQVSGPSVTPEDRDRAWNTGLRLNKTEWEALYDAFARHREQATHPASADVAAEVEAMRQMRLTAHDMGYSGVLEALEALAELRASADVAELVEALKWLVSEYVSNVDACRLGGFYRNPEEEECVVDARAALSKHRATPGEAA